MASKCKASSDVKHFLYTKVYHPRKQRILGFIQVSKTKPSKNPLKAKQNCHYLCLYVNSGKPYSPHIARYILSQSTDDFEERRVWDLKALQTVDGKSSSSGFELCFGPTYRFEAKSIEDKEKFIDELAEACKRYMDTPPPQFINVPAKVGNMMKKTADERSQLEKTRQDLEERGQKLSDVEKKTADMAGSAESFAGNAHKLVEHYQ